MSAASLARAKGQFHVIAKRQECSKWSDYYGVSRPYRKACEEAEALAGSGYFASKVIHRKALSTFINQ